MMSEPILTAPDDGYPRPDARRSTRWGLLNGVWDFAPGSAATPPLTWPTTITVPYGWETEASGVGLAWLESGWYRLRWMVPQPPPGHRLVVTFGAVHHECRVFVSGYEVAHHVGGQAPFEVDVTAEAGDITGDQELEICVAVINPAAKGDTAHGKQRSIPADPYDVCSFTPCSGIWQSVWWQHRPAGFIAAIDLTSTPALDGFDALVQTGGEMAADDTIVLEVLPTGRRVTLDATGRARLIIDRPRLWSPEDPYLYGVAAELRRGDQTLDRLTTFSGLRKIEVREQHLYLNDRRIFLRGVLDQGYWPGHGWTAPSWQHLVADLDAARRLGFNLVRKHLKLEDPRWLHHADRIGMLVWEEPPSASRYSQAATSAFSDQIQPMITRDRNHPSIVLWGLYNEEWGLDWDVHGDPSKQQVLRDAYELAKSLDASRPVIDNSGWEHVRTDVVDWHIYAPDQSAWTTDLDWIAANQDVGFVVDLDHRLERKHLYAARDSLQPQPRMNSEYGTGRTSVERAWIMRWQTQELRRAADNNGYVYTELYDIEHETAGLLCFDRSTKDDLGLESSDSHAETVIITDIVPMAPGRDLRAATGDVGFDVWMSHHGADVLAGALTCSWGRIGSRRGDPGTIDHLGEVKVQPFELCGPIPVRTMVPEGARTARLHLSLIDGNRVVAHSSVDIVAGESNDATATKPAIKAAETVI